ncbi:MAG: bifunctional phosphoribosylaminoimidazolecarboxamide formyltransferase/IMP cyclohydrolase [Candidatus Diapherotrites archaeon]|nr:bifunctional phosphoribosylaminoimidazolecarboxamide formyltransferase/IMP cyclohydrolase [Candidatus Diapherotrites archaeon]
MKIERALLSVYDKTGIIEFASVLNEMKIELISTGGTYKLLKENNIPVKEVSEITGSKEMLEGRVKTLHPIIHAGILAKRNSKHLNQLKKEKINKIDLICVNLYPFENGLKEKVSEEKQIELIDIGGPTMIRGAAKNFEHVAVISNPVQYLEVLNELKQNKKSLSVKTLATLATEAFELTSRYDAVISKYFSEKILKEKFPLTMNLSYGLVQKTRYGENPHQKAAVYSSFNETDSILNSIQLQGKEMSFNNFNDASMAHDLVKEFSEPAVVIVKHANPCGVAKAKTISSAFEDALASDPVSAFGGIIALNRTCDKKTAEKIINFFNEIVLAPDYDKDALEILSKKQNLRILLVENIDKKPKKSIEFKFISGGLLAQEADSLLAKEFKCVTKKKPSKAELESMKFAFTVIKQVKSNAIVLVQGTKTVGIGMGQTNRVDAVEQAIKRAGEEAKNAVLASDAYFPFPDSIEKAKNAGIKCIIQPGGSIRDKEVIAEADKAGIAMVFTGIRHFKH